MSSAQYPGWDRSEWITLRASNFDVSSAITHLRRNSLNLSSDYDVPGAVARVCLAALQKIESPLLHPVVRFWLGRHRLLVLRVEVYEALKEKKRDIWPISMDSGLFTGAPKYSPRIVIASVVSPLGLIMATGDPARSR